MPLANILKDIINTVDSFRGNFMIQVKQRGVGGALNSLLLK